MSIDWTAVGATMTGVAAIATASTAVVAWIVASNTIEETRRSTVKTVEAMQLQLNVAKEQLRDEKDQRDDRNRRETFTSAFRLTELARRMTLRLEPSRLSGTDADKIAALRSLSSFAEDMRSVVPDATILTREQHLVFQQMYGWAVFNEQMVGDGTDATAKLNGMESVGGALIQAMTPIIVNFPPGPGNRNWGADLVTSTTPRQ